jgi:hypothetical protein
MINSNEIFFTCIPGLTPEQHQASFRSLAKALRLIHTGNERTPKLIDALSFFEYLQDMDAYHRYFLPQLPVLATQYDDFLETSQEADSEAEGLGKSHWISPALALRFTRELCGQVPADLEAFLANIHDHCFFAWMHADGDADGVPIHDALRSLLDRPDRLPRVQFRDMAARIMALLWAGEVTRIASEHPGVEEQLLAMHEDADAGEFEICSNAEKNRHHASFEHALMESHCWSNHGVSAADFVFPRFFGISLDALSQAGEGGQK